MVVLLLIIVCRCLVLAITMDQFSQSSHKYVPLAFVNEWALAIHSLVVAPHDLRRLLVNTIAVSLILKLILAIGI